MGWSIKKPLGGKNSVVNRITKKPVNTLVGSMTGMGPTGSILGGALTDIQGNFASKMRDLESQMNSSGGGGFDELARMAAEEEAKRKALGEQQRGQIMSFADEQEGRAKNFRGTLAQSLSDTGNQFFQRLNPFILEDLNSRGLFTSQTARDQEQTSALADIARENEGSLRAFDTDMFNQINDIRGSALSAQLGGDQGALDSALALRKAGIQRRFDEQDANRERSFADMLAKRQSRDQLISSILGLGGQLGGGFLGRG